MFSFSVSRTSVNRIATVAALVLGVGASAAPVEFTPLNALPGAVWGNASSVSRDGRYVAGWCLFDPPLETLGPQGQFLGAQTYVACRWPVGGSPENLGFPPMYTNTRNLLPSAMNGAGNIVIGAPMFSQGVVSVFRWSEGVGFLNFNTIGLPESPRFWGQAVTDDGNRIVGTREAEYGTGSRAAVWIQGQGLQLLDPTSFSSEANAITPDGNWVVGRRQPTSASGAFRWSQLTGFQMIPGFGASVPNYAAYAEDVTPDGETVVGSAILPNGASAPYRWRASTGTVCLKPNTPPGFGITYGVRASADGAVVIGSEGDGGFIWYECGLIRKTSAYFRFLLGSTFGSQDGRMGLTGISGDGLTMVGNWSPQGVTVQPAIIRFAARPCSAADLASLGGLRGPDGQLTVDDVVVYLQAFFGNQPGGADIASLGGQLWPDDQITVDDLVKFLAIFFDACPQ